MRGRVGGARDHAVGVSHVDHHRAEVGHVPDLLARLLEGDALLRAQAREFGRVFLDELRIGGRDDAGLGQVDAELAGAGRDGGRVADEGDVGDAPCEDLGRGEEDAVVLGLGQDDALAISAGAIDEVGLEGEGRDGGGLGQGEQGVGPFGGEGQGEHEDVRGDLLGERCGERHGGEGRLGGCGAPGEDADLLFDEVDARALGLENEDDPGLGGCG